jgi:hypothetical protein
MLPTVNVQYDLPAALAIARFGDGDTLILLKPGVSTWHLLHLAQLFLKEPERDALVEFLVEQ